MKLKISLFFRSKYLNEIRDWNTLILLSNLHRDSLNIWDKKMQFLYLDIEDELDAHLFRIRSTHEYYNLAQYELQTPTHLGASSSFLIWTISVFPNKPIEKLYWLKIHVFFTKFTELFWAKKYENFQFHPKQNNLSNILSPKYLDFNFYANRSSVT